MSELKINDRVIVNDLFFDSLERENRFEKYKSKIGIIASISNIKYCYIVKFQGLETLHWHESYLSKVNDPEKVCKKRID